MTFNPDIHHRRSIRLQGYDYTAAGAYFVTLFTFQRECLFGEISIPTLSEIVRQLKTFSGKRINQLRDNPGCPVWQRNYYERVIRNQSELTRAREYIVNNPIKWALDKENPANPS